MPVEGFDEYKSREYCREVACPVQLELNKMVPGSPEYEKLRQTCRTGCRHTAWEFHHWLIGKGYLIVRPRK